RIRAPRTGTLLSVLVSPGQYVPAAAPLMTIADLSQLWVRVPIPEHDLPRVDRRQAATLVLKSAGSGTHPGDSGLDRSFPIQPVAVVPQVDTARHTADLIYELPALAAERGVFAKDQMVTVSVPLGEQRPQKETVVPYSAVIFDAYAGAWIYFDVTPKD